jgi:thiol:disulfide interchange protein
VLANPAVQVGIGLLFIALSLSMFGLYEIQIPTGAASWPS